ncbi:DUF3857 domain-containing protein [Mucilaginibacter segetis]|uniref:DUF3857 domain-containing protein n=1 Tax=Mucilaginibacter segetis TaxID=2793071 RepID=A0A934PU41_9SPHI|nr:DUF3857 domain-containing protein [Mucilaginibacter segetis]MBK0379181.1 DUF3857 domain-containing protein [Mucilaginibacter segetis]
MKLIYLAFLMLMLSVGTQAQQNYDVSLIPKDLLPYASAVIRNKDVTIEVKDVDNTIYHIKTAITVLNKNGDDIARIVIWYNKANSIKYIKGTTYNEFGKPMGKFSEKDFSDVNASNDFSLFEDSRVKHYIPSIGSYPYTIEYEYEQRSKQSLNFDDWEPNSFDGLAVEKSTFSFICKPEFKIRYKEINMPSSVNISTTNNGQNNYTWHVENVKAIRDEPYSPNPEQYLSMVKIAPENFEYEGIKGSFTNWRELGQWTYDKLLADRKQLSTETIQHVKELTAGISDPKLKAKKIYEFMQSKTRYISVQVGIGGYQPMLAADVDKLNYGDCKGLVNYTQALLKAVDIDSWYCVVEAGSRKVSLLDNFASMNQGNHVILCLPFKNDTTFLECTSQKIPFGFLSNFTDDRTVLACTPTGGKLIHTPKYAAAINLQERRANFTIDDKGALAGKISTTFKGTQYDNREEIIDEPLSEKITLLKEIYSSINNLNIKKLDIEQDKNILPVTTEKLEIDAREYAAIDNGKFYFSLNPLNHSGRPPRDIRNRYNPVYINNGYTDVDEINYNLPEGYRIDSAPLNISIDKPFGKFTAVMVMEGNKLVFKRRLQLISGTYDKNDYSELVNFYQTVFDADNYNVALVKK